MDTFDIADFSVVNTRKINVTLSVAQFPVFKDCFFLTVVFIVLMIYVWLTVFILLPAFCLKYQPENLNYS